MTTRPGTRCIGFIGYDNVTALDLVGPLEVFSTASRIISERSPTRRAPAYKTLVIGLNRKVFIGESGIGILPQTTLADEPRLDTLIIPGGSGLRETKTLHAVSSWLRKNNARTRRIASVCTGIYALAETGLLDGETVTTHWQHADELKRRYPDLRVDADAIFIRHGRFYTSAGITAGIDLSLALVEEDHGPVIALAVARELVVHLKRSGGQKQYSEPLSFQTGASDRLAELGSWLPEHLDEDLSTSRLAERCNLSPRQLNRRFQLAFGIPPAAYVERMRIEEARHRLSSSNAGIELIAQTLGYRSIDVFRRAFERQVGIAPALYRARFSFGERED